jgi:hypothetical protein
MEYCYSRNFENFCAKVSAWIENFEEPYHGNCRRLRPQQIGTLYRLVEYGLRNAGNPMLCKGHIEIGSDGEHSPRVRSG